MAAAKNILQPVLSILGYILYTLGVLVLLLWLLFPADSVRVWLAARLNILNPAIQWKIKSLRPAFPPSVVATGIRLGAVGDKEPLLEISEMQLSPDLAGLRAVDRRVPVRFRIRLLNGLVSGRAEIGDNLLEITSQGKMEDLELGLLDPLWRKIGRSFSGKVSGPFRYQGNWRNPAAGALHADLQITGGSIELMQPLFGFEVFDFNRLTAGITLQDREILIKEGRVDSRMLAASYSGSVMIADPAVLSKVRIDGSMEPRPELLGSLKNKAAATLIKNQLQDNRLEFLISGNLMQPGIVFKGRSGVIDGLIQGGGAR